MDIDQRRGLLMPTSPPPPPAGLVLELTDVPAIASHSSARHYTPGFERNMNDDMIKRLAIEGGVIQINFGSSFLTEQANGYGSRRSAAYDACLAATDNEDSK